MIFNSVTYLLFLAISVTLYWCLPSRPRLWMLFLGSLMFYGFWRFDFLIVMLASAVVDYVASLRLAKTEDPTRRKVLLAISLVLNLGLLGYFKYLQFVVDTAFSFSSIFGSTGESPNLGILLPLGISFYTFQTISYTIDVYRRQVEPIRDFLMYGLYVVFFPQLVAGPILRQSEVVPQLTTRPAFEYRFLIEGFKRVLVGLFLKVCCADNIAALVDDGFLIKSTMLSAVDVWTLAFLFGFQIYFDFSAYSHIAIGSARMMGISFPENFNFPYLAVSPKDFWGRWHISLSSWIRDYLYLPLCGVRFGNKSDEGLGTALESKQTRNRTFALFVTWATMGLWHGAGFQFLLWGLYHALVILIYRGSEPLRRMLPISVRNLGGWGLTLPTMMFGWIFFRAASAEQALDLAKRALSPFSLALGLRENLYLVAALFLVGIILAFWGQKVFPRMSKHPFTMFLLLSFYYAILIFFVTVFLRPVEQFIYFQF